MSVTTRIDSNHAEELQVYFYRHYDSANWQVVKHSYDSFHQLTSSKRLADVAHAFLAGRNSGLEQACQ